MNVGVLAKPFEIRSGNEKFCLPEGACVGSVGFTPFRVASYEPGMQSIALALLCRDLPVAFQQMQSWGVQPEYLLGITNKNMADFAAKNLGFRVIEKFPRKINRKIHERYQVAGEFKTVEAATMAFSARKMRGLPPVEVLMKRALEQASSPKLKLSRFSDNADADFDIDALIRDRGTGKPFLRIGFVTVGFGVVATGFAGVAFKDYNASHNISAALETAAASFFAFQAWRNRE